MRWNQAGMIIILASLQLLLMLELGLEPKDPQIFLNFRHRLQSRCRVTLQLTTYLRQIQHVIFFLSFFHLIDVFCGFTFKVVFFKNRSK
jgi:hypothetical protein